MSAPKILHREFSADSDDHRGVLFRFLNSALDMGHFPVVTACERKTVADQVIKVLTLDVYLSDPTLAEIIELRPNGSAVQ